MLPDLGLVKLVFISGLVCAASSESVVCPDSSQWSLRTRAFCNSTHPSLNCLYEETTSTFVQFCTPRPDFQRPGYKFIIRGNIDGIECQKNRFQPIKFWTNGSSDCILEKTRCNEPGQVIHVEGDSTSDRTCRCDYTKGFAFVSQRQGDCFCDPSLEDCSCFLKPCRKFQVMTPDYSCIDAKDWTGIFKCPVIKKTVYMTTSATTRCPTPSTEKTQFRMGLMVATKLETLALTVCSVLSVIIVIVVLICHRQIKECCRNLHMTDEKMKQRVELWREQELFDQAMFESEIKMQSTNYKDIITGIDTMVVVDKLSSRQLITESEKNSIDEFLGRRRKNKALLELVMNGEYSWYRQFIVTIKLIPSIKESGLVDKITEMRGFLEENSIYKKKPTNVTELEEYLINDKIPEDVRHMFDTCFNSWYKNDEKFTVTSATAVIKKKLRQNNCVLVVGRSGNGKTAIIRHLALDLFNEEGYDVIPIVLDLSTILQYHDPNRKQLFVLDDFCGKVETNDQTVQMWSMKILEVMELINRNPIEAQGSVKLLFATQPFLFELSSSNTVDCLSKYKVLLSEIPLGDQEKIDMIRKYLPKDHDGKVPEISSHNEDIIPVLCKLSEGKTANQIIQLFKDPNEIIKKNFNELKQTNKKQICLLSLCVLFKSLTNDIFSEKNTPDKNKIIEVVCSEFDLDFSNITTKLKLKGELTNLEKTFLVKSSDTYYFVHKDIYDIAAVSCGTILKNSFIRFGYSSFIAERYCYISKNTKKRENVIEFDDEETLKRYFDRLMNDLEQGITYSTFHNSQLIDESYRGEFCTYCRCKKTNMVKILDRLQNRASKPAATQHDTPKSSQEERINEYEDYIDFLQPWNFSSHNMKIPLIESAWEGYKEIVEMLIYFERDVNETDKFGRSALFVACYRGKTDVVQLLLEKKANNALHEANGKSPLYVACKRGHTQIVKILIDKHDNGVITSKCDNSMYSPLHAASAEGHKDIVKLLLSENNVDKCDYLGRSALFVASDKGKKDVVKSLLKGKANINECDLKGFSPLMAACSRGFFGVVEELINAKPKDIKINDQDVEGRSALFIASKKGHDKIVNFLLKHNADVLQLDCHRQSPLFIASFFGKEEIVKMLVKNVKHVNAISQSDEEDKTPLFIACEKGLEKIVDILLPECSLGVRVKTDNKQRSPLYVACRGGFIGIVKKLKSNEEQINEKNTWHETPLFAASRGGHVDVVRYLVENNADLNTAEYNGHTPLWIACDEGHVEIVELLVEKGATINLQDNDKRTPLYAASKGNYVDVVRYLIDKSAKLDSAESNGQTPLWIACDEGHDDIVNILVDKGANINLQNNDNKTPFDIANMKGHTNIKNILKQKMLQEQKTVVKDVSE